MNYIEAIRKCPKYFKYVRYNKL